MSKQATGHPVSVEIRTPAPVPVAALSALTDLVQDLADRLGAGTLIFGKDLRQEGDGFVFSFAGHAPTAHEDDEDLPEEPFICTAASKDPIR